MGDMTRAPLPLFGPAFSAREASELSGAPLGACRWLLGNTWARSEDSPAEHLTVMELVMLGAAHAFGLTGHRMQEFFVLLRRQKRPDGPFLITLEQRHRPLVPVVRRGTSADLPPEKLGLLVYDALPILLATGSLDRPEPKPDDRTTPAPTREPVPSGRQDALFGPRQDELF